MKGRRRLRRSLLCCLALVGLLLLVIVVVIAGSWRCRLQTGIHRPMAEPAAREAAASGIKGYLRPEADTFLSYPEWYIVWSYQEKADFQQTQLPSAFPYFGAVRQYWGSYCCISRLVRGQYASNFGEEVMLVVIGTSFSAEYVLKGAYEKTIGRLSEWTSGDRPVEEDGYAYGVARQYADFVQVRPFYEFHFARHVKGLWTSTPLWGAHWPRKWERKAFLTADYSAEAFYCWLIERATHITYGYEPADTYAWIEHVDESLFQRFPRVRRMKQVGRNAFIVDIPRYQEFTSIAVALAEGKVHFVEIAGNSQILISVLAAPAWRYVRSDARLVFTTPVLTHPGRKRAVLACDVTSLDTVLRSLTAENIAIEHVYDY